MDKNKLSVEGKKLFNFIEFDADEKLVGEVRKHPFGLITIYFTGGLVIFSLILFLIAGPAFLAGSGFIPSAQSGLVRAIISILGVILVSLAVIMTAIGVYLYNHNAMIITSEKLAQVLYKTIFDRKISQLSIGDIQDVTVTQKGIFARLFNFGTIVVETSGEQQNYTFTFVPEPYTVAKQIVGAHEENLKKYGN